jgi:hypothetical protein
MHEGGAWSVMQQRRWVSYIYRYREFVRCEIAGFIKVQRISNKDTDVTRIRMGMKMYKEYACTCYAYLLWHGQAKPFTAVQFAAGERDTILTSVELPWSNPLGDGVAFPEYDGVYFVCDDGEILAGIWSTERYDLRQVQVTDRQDGLVEQEEPVLEYAGAGTKPQEEPVEEIPQIPLPSDMANGYEEMLTTYPKLPLFAGSQIVDGVKIAPQDIGKLDMANWNPSLHDRPGTHLARLQRHIHCAILQPPVTQHLGRLFNRHDLCMRKCRLVHVPPVVTTRDHLSFIDDHTSDRHITIRRRLLRKRDRLPHISFILTQFPHIVPHFRIILLSVPIKCTILTSWLHDTRIVPVFHSHKRQKGDAHGTTDKIYKSLNPARRK